MTDPKKPRSKPSLRSPKAKATFTKKKTRAKTSDIYERFLNRVHKIENDSAQDSAIAAPSIPNEDDGFDLDFTFPDDNPQTENPQGDANQDIDPDFLANDDYNDIALEDSQNDDLPAATPIADQTADDQSENRDNSEDNENFTNDAVIAATTEANTEEALPVTKTPVQKKPTTKLKTKPEPSRLKTLVVGVICGLVISGSAIAILNSLGVIRLQTQNLQAKEADISAPKAASLPENNVKTPENKTNATANPKPATENVPNTANLEANVTAKANAEKRPQDEPKQTPKPAPTEPTPSQDANLSYQDFAEEAGTTLYRDSN